VQNDFHDGLYAIICEETFEKCSILFKVKSKIPDFERGKARILTTGIPVVFRGLEFEPDAEIGQKRAFFKGLVNPMSSQIIWVRSSRRGLAGDKE
jgi:hypothetical protein